MSDYIREERPVRVKPSKHDLRERKKYSKERFHTLSEMRKHHNAIETLYKNGYDGNALRQIAGEFQDSIQFALADINRMRENMSEIIES